MKNNDKSYIRQRLRDHLLLLESEGLISKLPAINWENRRFEVPQVDGQPQPYLRETLMMAGEDMSANDERTNRGILQLDLMIPSGGDLKIYEDQADLIKAHFKPAQDLSGVWITRAEVLQGIPENPWYQIPIRINFKTHQQNT